MNSPDLSQILKSHKGASRRGKVALIAGVVIIAAIALALWKGATASNSGPSYVTETVKRGDIRVAVNATGNLAPINEVTIGSELSGTVLTVAVDTNDQVKKGQVLARLDPSKLAQQTESSRATAAAAQARVEQAQATVVETDAAHARLEKLKQESGGKLPSQADMDTAIAAAARAHADLASAQADVRQASGEVGANESDLQKMVICSPIDGIILTRNVEPGQTVAATMTAPELFVVAENLKKMKLEVAVAEADIGRVKAGQQATFFVDAWPDRSFQATVKKVEYGSAVTDNVVTYKTDLEVSNDDLSLRPGMTATAEIAVAEAKDVLTVPNAALRFDPAAAQSKVDAGEKKSFIQSLFPGPPRRSRPKAPETPPMHAAAEKEPARIWVLKDGKPEPIQVKTGLTDGSATEISGAGLSEGLPVIVHSQTATP